MLSAGVARTGKATTGSYAVSKAALEAMVRVYAVESAGTQIRINIVNPGPTRTRMRARAAPEEDPMTLKTPEDIAPRRRARPRDCRAGRLDQRRRLVAEAKAA